MPSPPPRLHLLPSPPPVVPAPVRRLPRARLVCAVLALLLFHLIPWLRIDQSPVLLLDLSARHAYLGGVAIAGDALTALFALALAAAAALYLLTHLGGRLWCAFACPQSLLTLLYQHLCQFTGRRVGQWLWAMLATCTGVVFLGYFIPIQTLMPGDLSGWNGWSLFWAGFYALATWANIVFMGNRACTELCPFARLQDAIGDAHTPHVRYHAARGEPRGPRLPGSLDIARRGRRLLDAQTAQDYVFRAANPDLAGPWPRFAADRLGDCSDCGRCVSACPLGLDIRNGHDARCIDCGQCIDACDAAMAADGQPGGLLQRRSLARHLGQRVRTIRTRTVLATLILVTAALSAAHLLA